MRLLWKASGNFGKLKKAKDVHFATFTKLLFGSAWESRVFLMSKSQLKAALSRTQKIFNWFQLRIFVNKSLEFLYFRSFFTVLIGRKIKCKKTIRITDAMLIRMILPKNSIETTEMAAFFWKSIFRKAGLSAFSEPLGKEF